MHTQLSKWGNSVAIRLPKALLGAIGLEAGSSVEIRVDKDRLIIEPRRRYKLDDLVRGITEANRHATEDEGALGDEQW